MVCWTNVQLLRLSLKLTVISEMFKLQRSLSCYNKRQAASPWNTSNGMVEVSTSSSSIWSDRHVQAQVWGALHSHQMESPASGLNYYLYFWTASILVGGCWWWMVNLRWPLMSILACKNFFNPSDMISRDKAWAIGMDREATAGSIMASYIILHSILESLRVLVMRFRRMQHVLE